MGRKLSGREIGLLAFLGIVATVMAIYNLGGGGLGGGSQVNVEDVQVGEAPVINMARLTLPTEGYDPNGRDLFKYGSPPRVKTDKPPPPPPPPPVKRERRPPTTRPTTRPTERTPVAAPAPRPKFDYLGHLGPKDNWYAVLEEDDELKTVKIGEKINDDFRLRGFKFNAVVVDYVDQKWKDLTAEVELKQARSRRR